MKLINLTPHDVNVAGGIVIPPTAPAARVSVDALPATDIESEEYGAIPVVVETFGAVTDLPAPAKGIGYIVSRMVAAAPMAAGRSDLFVPGEPVRDEAGRVIGVKTLVRP